MKKFLLILFVIFAASCSRGAEAVNEGVTVAEDIVDARGGGDIETWRSPVERMMIREGSMRIEVGDLARARRAVDALVAECGAYYADESYNDYKSGVEYSLRIKIPAGVFDRFIETVERGGYEVKYKNISANDITEQYRDIEMRLENKRSYLARYRELLGRATAVSEILEIENEIRAIEEEIESFEGRRRMLAGQVEYSTLNLSISELRGTMDGFWERAGKALAGGWTGFIHVLFALLYLWPFLVVGIVVLLIVLVRSKK